MSTSTDVLVVGAGPTGLTLACDLRRRGVDCRVVDRAPTHHTRSRGKGLQPRSLEVFDDLGIADAALAAGRSSHRLHLYSGGRLALDLDLPARPPKPGVPYPNLLVLPQWRTEQVLRDRLVALGGDVELGRELVDLEQDDDGVTATVTDRSTGAVERIRAAHLVGCDGGGSRVRGLTGIPMRGDSHPEHFVLADVRIEGLPADGWSFAWFDDDRYLAADPLDGSGTWQVQANVRPDASGTVETASLELFQRLFAERGFAQVRLSDATWLSDFSPRVAIVDRYRAGRVLLAGDAAHVHSPAGGQGMNTGIQDAYNLGWKLDAVVRRKADDRLLDSYQEERMPVARSVLTGSDLGHSAVFSPHPVMTLLRDRVLVPALRLPVVQNAILDSVAELGVGYRDSSLVGEVGTVGLNRDGEAAGPVDHVSFRRGPRAGDRAPDATGRDGDTGAPTRLFDLFRGTHLTLLLFDGPAATDAGYERLAATARAVRAALGDDVRACVVVPAERRPRGLDGVDVLLDPDRDAHHRYGAAAESLYLVRPDGYVGFRGQPAAAQPVLDHLARLFTVRATV
ncbi:FAD-dependent monooxygenase [Geodermatophilus maliterrae]|uniref:FAD-dependent monooxygenase n=1 Tax=Geodermatophilus maliterrae TaxID=3162531 RepID=A0ABV3X9L7_9ACTN